MLNYQRVLSGKIAHGKSPSFIGQESKLQWACRAGKSTTQIHWVRYMIFPFSHYQISINRTNWIWVGTFPISSINLHWLNIFHGISHFSILHWKKDVPMSHDLQPTRRPRAARPVGSIHPGVPGTDVKQPTSCRFLRHQKRTFVNDSY